MGLSCGRWVGERGGDDDDDGVDDAAVDDDDDSLLQVASLLQDIEQSLRRLPLLLAGDLNSLPESAVYPSPPPLTLQPKTPM